MKNISTDPVTGGRNGQLSMTNRTLFLIFLFGFVLRVAAMLVGGNNGGDGYVRYELGVHWLQHPSQLPSLVYLPLHPVLMGLAYAVWHSEMSPRLLTVVLGSLSILLFGDIVRRLFSPGVAVSSTLTFALFGFHIAYSMTTSSEVPTLFFLVLGTYGWLRYVQGQGERWLCWCLVGFGCAALCKPEAWLFMPVLTFFTLDWSRGLESALHNKRGWRMAVLFGIASSAGAFGLMLFAYLKWGDPIAFAHRSFAIGSQVPADLRPSVIRRIVAQPGALFITLTPAIAVLIAIGIGLLYKAHGWVWKVPAAVALVCLAAWCYVAVYHNGTMARYTLLYSWLFIPYAFTAIESLTKGPVARVRNWMGVVVATAVLWQGAVLAAAYYAPAPIANKLSSVAVTLPMRPDIRMLTSWLRTHVSGDQYVLVDNFNEEPEDVIRLSGLDRSHALLLPWLMRTGTGAELDQRVRTFILEHHPQFIVYSPLGRLHLLWQIDDRPDIEITGLGMHLQRDFAKGNYRVYRVSYSSQSAVSPSGRK